MFEEDQETLPAKYVLGTLSGEDREHAEALRSFDPEFDAAVRQWERRLGELNVMVEAVEPPPQVWDGIKAEMTSLVRGAPEYSGFLRWQPAGIDVGIAQALREPYAPTFSLDREGAQERAKEAAQQVPQDLV